MLVSVYLCIHALPEKIWSLCKFLFNQNIMLAKIKKISVSSVFPVFLFFVLHFLSVCIFAYEDRWQWILSRCIAHCKSSV